MRLGTVIVSTALHLGLAAGLITVAEKKGLGHKAISVAVTSEKKKVQPKPVPPTPIAHVASPKLAALPRAQAPVAATPRAAPAAPVAMNLAMSNADLDVGPGIGLEGRAKPASTAAPVKVASAISEARTRRAQQEVGGEAPCEEEPTHPEAIVKTPIDYTIYPQAQADGIEGKFKARLIIDADGQVAKVEVLAGIDPGFDAAIEAALKRWRFKPAMACGKPVAGGVVPFNARFELGD